MGTVNNRPWTAFDWLMLTVMAALVALFVGGCVANASAQEPPTIWRVEICATLPLPGVGDAQLPPFGYTFVVKDVLSRELLAKRLEDKAKEVKYEIFAAQVRRAAAIVRQFPSEIIPVPEPVESQPAFSASPWSGDGLSYRGDFKWEGKPAAIVLRAEIVEELE